MVRDRALKPVRKHFVGCVVEVKLTSFDEEDEGENDEVDGED